VVRAADFSLIAGQLYKMGPDEILRRCVMEAECPMILEEAHEGMQEDITQEKKLRRRFCELAFGGLRYTEMFLKITILNIVRRLHIHGYAEMICFRMLHTVRMRTFRTVLKVRVRKCFLKRKRISSRFF
jgi:hypothetical protein